MQLFKVIPPFKLKSVTTDAAVTQMRFTIDSKMMHSWSWDATHQVMTKRNRSAKHPRISVGTKIWIAEHWRFSKGATISIEYLNNHKDAASWKDAANNPWQSPVRMKYGDHRAEYKVVGARMAKDIYAVTEADAVACGYQATATSSAAVNMQQDWLERHGIKACHRPHWVFDVQKVI